MLVDYSKNASKKNSGKEYSLKCFNNSKDSTHFYIYQTLPLQKPDTFSIVWMTSPFSIAVNSFIIFKWDTQYNFIWGHKGKIGNNVNFNSGGSKDANLFNANTTTFDLVNNTPDFNTPIKENPEGSFVIHNGKNIPNNKFLIGIGMSGCGTIVQKTDSSEKHTFTPNSTPTYWIASGDQMQVGTVLDTSAILPKFNVNYNINEYEITIFLNDKNEWDII